MRFEDKSNFGLLGEHICLDVIRWQDGLEVKLNTGPGFTAGYGIRFHSGDHSEVVPDLDIFRFLSRTREYAEVKTKAGFCMWNYDKPSAAVSSETIEVRTGIDLKSWHSYQWYSQKYCTERLRILFVQVLPIVQLRNREYADVKQVCGIYMQEITILDSLLKHGAGVQSGQMIYWPVNDLVLFRSEKSLMSHLSTAQLWNKLHNLAEQSVARRLLKKVDLPA